MKRINTESNKTEAGDFENVILFWNDRMLLEDLEDLVKRMKKGEAVESVNHKGTARTLIKMTRELGR